MVSLFTTVMSMMQSFMMVKSWCIGFTLLLGEKILIILSVFSRLGELVRSFMTGDTVISVLHGRTFTTVPNFAGEV